VRLCRARKRKNGGANFTPARTGGGRRGPIEKKGRGKTPIEREKKKKQFWRMGKPEKPLNLERGGRSGKRKSSLYEQQKKRRRGGPHLCHQGKEGTNLSISSDCKQGKL